MAEGAGTTLQESASVAPPARAIEALNTASAGIVVERLGQLCSYRSSEGRALARELAYHVNTAYGGLASIRFFDETFGTRGCLRSLLHVRSLDAYEKLLGVARDDARWRDLLMGELEVAGGRRWEPLFVAGSVRETVLMPQSFGMYGTAELKPENLMLVEGESVERFLVPDAQHQTSQSVADTLHSGNCGLLMHRTGELAYEFRAEGRQFARALAEDWNASLTGHATIFLYEEVFGLSDRIHWLIHLKSLNTYYNLMGLRARIDPAAREVFTKSWIPQEKGGGGWERLFVQGSLQDVALTPWVAEEEGDVVRAG